ncbi:MAG: winged helix-turn-helix transcriptional regulator, partial [Candidatus Aegiribacteria sp.]|nr:winged helix-turn-helix transcriptional regulator [Candidatus Aegiribacteria sp.]
IIQAREMYLMMKTGGLSQAELARKLGLSRARVTQMLNLLVLPEVLISEIEEMGDYWSRQLVTERKLRKKTNQVI